MAVCPFCDNAAAWPEDIVVVFLDRPVRAIPYDRLIGVSGTLHIGTETDAGHGLRQPGAPAQLEIRQDLIRNTEP